MIEICHKHKGFIVKYEVGIGSADHLECPHCKLIEEMDNDVGDILNDTEKLISDVQDYFANDYCTDPEIKNQLKSLEKKIEEFYE